MSLLHFKEIWETVEVSLLCFKGNWETVDVSLFRKTQFLETVAFPDGSLFIVFISSFLAFPNKNYKKTHGSLFRQVAFQKRLARGFFSIS